MTLPPPPPPPPIDSKHIGKSVTIVIVVVTIITIAVVAFVALPLLGITAPKPEITMKQGREGLSGFNYVYYVDATVVNHGASGSITVYAEIPALAEMNNNKQASI